MKKYIKASVSFPENIMYHNKVYEQQYLNEAGAMYYQCPDMDYPFDAYVALYPDGEVTYLFNGNEIHLGNLDFNTNIVGE